MTKVIQVELGGRKLRQIVRSTVKHDLWLMDKIRRSGMREITMMVGESAEDFASRLLDTLIQSNSVTPLIAGCFMDEDMDDLKWSPESAMELAKFIDELDSEQDKSKVFEIVVSLVTSFLETGVVSLMTSLNSLKKDQLPQQKDVDEFGKNLLSAETPTLENLKTQLGRCPEMTGDVFKSSSIGH